MVRRVCVEMVCGELGVCVVRVCVVGRMYGGEGVSLVRVW